MSTILICITMACLTLAAGLVVARVTYSDYMQGHRTDAQSAMAMLAGLLVVASLVLTGFAVYFSAVMNDLHLPKG